VEEEEVEVEGDESSLRLDGGIVDRVCLLSSGVAALERQVAAVSEGAERAGAISDEKHREVDATGA